MKNDLELEAEIVGRNAVVEAVPDERERRVWVAAGSLSIGYGGDVLVSGATGISLPAICSGRLQIASGRPTLGLSQPGLDEALEKLVDPGTRGVLTDLVRIPHIGMALQCFVVKSHGLIEFRYPTIGMAVRCGTPTDQARRQFRYPTIGMAVRCAADRGRAVHLFRYSTIGMAVRWSAMSGRVHRLFRYPTIGMAVRCSAAAPSTTWLFRYPTIGMAVR